MKIKKLVIVGGVMALCSLGFIDNANASAANSGRILSRKMINIEEKINSIPKTVVQTEETVEEDTYVNPCIYGHENCDGIHANEDCPYHENCDGTHANANCEYHENCTGEHLMLQDGSGMGYHHNGGAGNQQNGTRGHHGGNHHN